MTDYKTKQDVDAEIERLKKLREGLPDRIPIKNGWELRGGPAMIHLLRKTEHQSYACIIAIIGPDGISIIPSAYDGLNGIAHDDKGRIKVLGYVNAQELKTWMYDNLPHKSLSDFNGRPIFEGRAMQQMWDIIDELAG